MRTGTSLAFLSLILLARLSWAQSLPDASRDIGASKKWSESLIQQGESDFKTTGQNRRVSPDFWGQNVVYQIQVDRFNDGDTANNNLNLPADQRNNNLKGILDFRHGGDLKGIIQRLDYLQDLGVNTLWITPFLKHNGSYHGYCSTDLTQVDPGFGTNEDFRELVKQAHQRNIMVVMDVVINHLCDDQTFYSKPADHYRCVNEIDAKNWSGEAGSSTAQGELQFSDNFFKPLKSPFFFNRCGTNSGEDMRGTGPAAVYGDFVQGMFDYDTRNQDFQTIFTNIFKYWIAETDVDGYRLDAAKHVSEDFIAYFSTEVRDYARKLNKNNFYVVGEVAGPSDWMARRLGQMESNPKNPAQHGNVPQTLTSRLLGLQPIYSQNAQAPYPGLTGVYDFSQSGIAVAVLQNQKPPAEIENYFNSSIFSDIAAQNDDRLNWHLLEIHDWPRFASLNLKAMDKSILGAAYLAFSEGMPIVQYGFEQGFNGDCHFDSMNVGNNASDVQNICKSGSDALYRQDMFFSGMERLGSTVPEIDALAYIGPAQKLNGVDPYINQQHKLYKDTRKFIHIRNSCKALKFGKTNFRWMERNSNAGLLAFSRIDSNGADTFEALVILNTASDARALPDMQVTDFSNGHMWKNLLNGFEQAKTSGNGNLSFNGMTIGPNSMMVFVPQENASGYDSHLETQLCVQ
ncbi:MAG: alpha-amylase family glycosyl hydrolase [Pseudobdellovibrio sp.]